MRCPFCSEDDTQVKDSRASDDGASIRRRRLCTGCGSRFTTFERIQLRDLIVVKRNGKKYEGLWAGVTDNNRLWAGARNGLTFGRWDKNNPQALSTQALKKNQSFIYNFNSFFQ